MSITFFVLERDTVEIGRQVTIFLTQVLLHIRLAESGGSALVLKYGKGEGTTIPLQAWTGT